MGGLEILQSEIFLHEDPTQLVKCPGNPRVFLLEPVPAPVCTRTRVGGYGFLRGSLTWTPGLPGYPYPRRVTRGFLSFLQYYV